MKNRDDNLNEIIASRIYDLCKLHDITLEQFAEKSGIPMQDLEAHLNGEGEWWISEMKKISTAFEVCIAYLIGQYQYPLPFAFTPEDLRLLKIIAPMNEEQLDQFVQAMKEVAKMYNVDTSGLD